MARTYFYFVRTELGEILAEYVSSAPPPAEGATLDLRSITSKYQNVQVTNVEEFPLAGHTDVKVTAQLVA